MDLASPTPATEPGPDVAVGIKPAKEEAMNRSSRASLFVYLALMAIPVGVAPALAAKPEFPNRPLRYIVAFPAGGASDVVARIAASALTDVLGVQVIVDNRGGASGTIGAEAAARATPDGYTLFACNIASLAVSPALYRNLRYDPERDFAPVGMIASNPNALSVNSGVPATTIAEFIDLAKSRPGQLNYASAGVGTSPQLSMEMFRMKAGIDIVHVPYKAIGTAIVDLISGQVQAMFSTVPTLIGALRSGKIRALGVTSSSRDPELPDVPTIAESGMPGFEVISWQGLCTPAGVPKETARPDSRRPRRGARPAGNAQASCGGEFPTPPADTR